jgi:hypothetical protein
MIAGLDGKGVLAGLGAVAFLAAGIVVGSRTLRYYDPILLTYTFGALFSAFAVAYRYAVWLQRPPTSLYVRRGFRLLRRGGLARNLLFVLRAAFENLAAHRFIRRRSFSRWFVHFLIAWGSLIAGAVTFPLVFGWLHFESVPERPETFRAVFLGVTLLRFDVDSPVRFVLFNLLNLSAVMVIVGAGLALRRRLKDPASLSRQQFGNDLVPLLLLLAIAFTGLLLTFSTHALRGAGSQALSLLHAVTVSLALLYVPFGKFFHVFQRPAHVAVILYRREGAQGPSAACRRCGAPFAPAVHVGDLRDVTAAMGFSLDLDTCPACKRRALGVAQARALAGGARG